MAKGNHVFNQFDKGIKGIFEAVVTSHKDQSLTKHFKALYGNSNGDMDAAKVAVKGAFPRTCESYENLINHQSMKRIHEVQDSKPVIANDGNSKDYGRAMEDFAKAAYNWAFGIIEDGGENPMKKWQQVVNQGRDPVAEANYVAEAGKNEKDKAERAKECQELDKFVRGEMTKFILYFLQSLRVDLKKFGDASYEPAKPTEWAEILKSVTIT